METEKLIAIGASTGGTDAIFNILRLLPPSAVEIQSALDNKPYVLTQLL
jgi:chemotaxis response regulator CheB